MTISQVQNEKLVVGLKKWDSPVALALVKLLTEECDHDPDGPHGGAHLEQYEPPHSKCYDCGVEWDGWAGVDYGVKGRVAKDFSALGDGAFSGVVKDAVEPFGFFLDATRHGAAIWTFQTPVNSQGRVLVDLVAKSSVPCNPDAATYAALEDMMGTGRPPG